MEEVKPSPAADSTPLTPLGFLERSATVYGNCPSVVYNDKTYTWSETHRRCLRVASMIASMGIERGHVVSVVAPNVPAMYELHFTVPMAGMIFNTINTRLDARTISVLLQHGESKLVFVDHEYSSLTLQSLSLFPSNTPRPKLILITDDEPSSESTVDFPINYETLVKNGDPEYKWVQPKTERDPIVLNYTSGTTSAPKGVVHYHRGIFLVVLDSLIDWSVPKQAVYLWTLPMFHVNGWSFTWGMAAVGGTNICIRKFELESSTLPYTNTA
ncbi:hypothetical protein Vadar_007737 [Vaccinium darrowii]|uniref:Uncharacterized protein n=1 Tax=Vaccinium darrowii TaxID=229202 RepID=A0ACB7Y5G9_9ERIC|nr:hypothetical protein Vadar_007737 [Vaccinium darrowii]